MRGVILKTAALGLAVMMPAALPAATDAPFTNPDVGVPVFPYDLTDRPYEVLGEVKAKVGKATIFSREASQTKIYRELWERARKLGADAVVDARYGDPHVTAFNWGSTTATGKAVRFMGDAAVKAPTSGN